MSKPVAEEEQHVQAFINGVTPLIKASLMARALETLIEACERAHRMAGGDGAATERADWRQRRVEYRKSSARVLATRRASTSTDQLHETWKKATAVGTSVQGSGIATGGASWVTRMDTSRASVQRPRP